MVVVGIWSKPAGGGCGLAEGVLAVWCRCCCAETDGGLSHQTGERGPEKQEGIRKEGKGRGAGRLEEDELVVAKSGGHERVEEEETRVLARGLRGGDGGKGRRDARRNRLVRTMEPSKVHAAAGTE